MKKSLLPFILVSIMGGPGYGDQPKDEQPKVEESGENQATIPAEETKIEEAALPVEGDEQP